MKILIAMLLVGNVGTFLFMNSQKSTAVEAKTRRPIVYQQVNPSVFKKLKILLADQSEKSPTLMSLLNDLTVTKEIHLHTPRQPDAPKAPIVPIVTLWTALSFIAFMLLRKQSQSAPVTPLETEAQAYPRFKKIIGEPYFNVNWQNKKAKSINVNSANLKNSFGDLNQAVAELAVKMDSQFKSGGKFLDLNLNKSISDCFIEKKRLEGLVSEFVISCYQTIKSNPELPGMYIRTSEATSRYSVSCFLMNFKKESLESSPLTLELLRKFSVLEAQYEMCGPTIDFRYKQNSEVSGLDITLTFENISELESYSGNTFSNA